MGADSVVAVSRAVMDSNEYSFRESKTEIETYLCLIPIGIIIFAAKSGREMGRFCVMIVIQVENEKAAF